MFLKSGSDSLIIVLHEIYGINQHIYGVCNKYHSDGYDIYCPDLLNLKQPFKYSQQKEAYRYFMDNIGFSVSEQITLFIKRVRSYYKKIIIVGFSVGATIAWICANNKFCDAVICYYGSRIRDFLDIIPITPALIIFASQEKSFSSIDIIDSFSNYSNINAVILEGDHGFCDPFSKNFNKYSAMKAEDITKDFIAAL